MFLVVSEPVCKPANKGLVRTGGEFNTRCVGQMSSHLILDVHTTKNNLKKPLF